jgi:hypothetical protein
MEAVRTSETSVYSNETTWRYVPEGSKLHTRRRENLKSRTANLYGEATLIMPRPDDGAVPTSEMSVYSNETTRRYVPEGSNLQRDCCSFPRWYMSMESHG